MRNRNRLLVLVALLALVLASLACAGGTSTQVKVINNSSATICYLYVSPSSSDSWGDDQLGSEVISAGDEFTVTVDPDTYDLRAETCDGDFVERFGEVLDAGTTEWELTD